MAYLTPGVFAVPSLARYVKIRLAVAPRLSIASASLWP